MNDRDSFGFPFLLTGANEQAEMPHRQSDLTAQAWNRSCNNAAPAINQYANNVRFSTSAPHPKDKLSIAKAIAAEVCARRFPVTKIPKEQQE
jgi:hypothetical protein